MKQFCLAISIVMTSCLLFILSCGGGGGSTGQTGDLSLKLTDATTTDYKAVYITVKEIKVSRDSADTAEEDCEWITVATPGKTYNLLELVNGVSELLATTTIEAGQYNQLRMVLDPGPDGELNILGENHPFGNYLIDPADEAQELKVPSGFESGFKIVGGFTIDPEQINDIVMDFNVLKSVIQAGASGKWILKPTVKLLDEEASATLFGVVVDASTDLPLEGVMVSAQMVTEELDSEIASAATVTDETGAYQLLVEPGAYMLVAAMDGYKSAHVEMSVASGDESAYDFAMEPGQGQGTITGLVQILDGTDEQFITINIRQTTQDGNIVEVATASVANGGQYTIDLPEGTYSMVAVFTVNGEEMTMEADNAFTIFDGTVIEFDILFEDVDEAADDDGESTAKPEKVTICHKGRTITVSSSALQAHLRHGDAEGACGEGSDDDGIDSEEACQEGECVDGAKMQKVTVCHKGREIRIAEAAVPAHLNHGDTLGSCNDADAGDQPDDTSSEDPGDDPVDDGADEEL